LDSFSSKIVFPGDLSYPLSTLTYNLAIQHNSSAIVYVSDAKDVSKAIKCASKFRVPVVARSGGHSYASFSSSPQGLIIDVTNLKDFSFATNHVGEVGEMVTFGAGLRLGDLDMALEEHERAVPHGVCPYVGGQYFSPRADTFSFS
jgi:FAD/FMN-containing dehydrogenase